MSALGLEVTSEVAYDLMQDHLETILALLEKPLPRQKVIQQIGSEIVLERLIRQGLVRCEGNTLYAVADVYHQLRQESMMSFLQRYVLPSLTASIEGQDIATVNTRLLTLGGETIRSLRPGAVQLFFNQLVQISDRPSRGIKSRLSVLVVGTSRIVHTQLDPTEQILIHVKQASIQRSSSDERDLAMLTQFDFLADQFRYDAVCDAMDIFLQHFDSMRSTSADEATYHLTVATHWRRSARILKKRELC